MKQTAVEWLAKELLREHPTQTNHDVIKQAKEMENQQKGYSEEEVMNMACALFEILQLRKKVEKKCENIAYNTNDIFDGIQYMDNGIGEVLGEHNINIDKLTKYFK
jgi:hypothetical protein